MFDRRRANPYRLALLVIALLGTSSVALAGRGGPDAGGWVWYDSDEPTVDNQTDSPASWTTVISPWLDETVVPVPLSFPFTLYGVTSSTVWVSSNGWLSLVDPLGNAQPVDAPMPSPGAPNAVLAYFWDDLDGGTTSFLQHGAVADGHVLLVRHNHIATNSLVQAFIQFYRSGCVKVVYSGVPSASTMTIGIENQLGSAGTQLVHDGTTDPALRFRNAIAIQYCPSSTPNCPAAANATCGSTVPGTTTGGGTQATTYGCSPLRYGGRDRVYALTLPTAQSLSVTVNGFGRDLDVFVLRAACDGNVDCVAGGADSVNLSLAPAGDYYIVVDGKTPADDGTFNLNFACGSISSPIACGGSVFGTGGATGSIDSYSCRTGAYTVGENLYDFTLASPQTVTATLTPGTAFDVFLADRASLDVPATSCLRSGDAGVAALNLPAGDYTLVVDGLIGATGDFALDLDCQPQVPARTVACGQVDAPNDNTAPSRMETYPGITGTYAAGEAYYRFNPGGPARVTVTTADSAAYDLITYLESEAPTSRIGFGATTVSMFSPAADDFLLVLDSTATTGPTRLSVTCVPMTTTGIGCDTRVSGRTGAVNLVQGYDCLSNALNGGESFFVLTNPVTQTLAVGLSGVPAMTDLDLIIMDGPFDTVTPICSAGGDEVAFIPNAPPGDYLIIVDGAAAAMDVPFELITDCGTDLTCVAAGDLTCNSVISGDTTAAGSDSFAYGKIDAAYTGPELIYHFTNPVQQTVNFRLENFSDPGLDLILLDACDRGAVVGWGDEVVIAGDLPAGDYYVVVEGRDGASGTFDLVTFCAPAVLLPPILNTVLRPGECYQETKELYMPYDVPTADVMFSFDLSRSMDQELDQMKRNVTTIYNELERRVPSLTFGLMSFTEYATCYTDTVCGGLHCPTGPTPYPFLIHQSLTEDINLVDDVIQTMYMIGGANGETYIRTFYEAYTNPGIGWRECARRVWVNIGDELPSECNVFECVGGTGRNVGRDPGPDLITGTADDLLLLPTVDTMAANGIVLIHIDSSEQQRNVDLWDCVAQRTGGQAFATDRNGIIPGGVDIVTALVGVIEQALQPCPEIILEPVGTASPWVTVTPPSWIGVSAPFHGTATIDFCVPLGVPAGTYDVSIVARCVGGDACAPDVIGTQQVTIEVDPCLVEPVAQAAPLDPLCDGGRVTLDGSSSSACSPAGLRYRWLEGVTVLCDWSTSPLCDVVATSSTTYTLEIECIDTPECVATTSVPIEVIPLPVAAAGPDVTVCELDRVVLDGSGSTDPGCPGGLLYTWLQGTTVVRPASTDPTWTPPTTTASTTTYTLLVACAGDPDCDALDPVTVIVEECVLAVDFDYYRAERVTDDAGSTRVAVTWGTLTELDTVAFLIERADRADGVYTRVGPPVAAEGPGHPYRWLDPDPLQPLAPTPWYRVVEFTLAGRGDTTGPFSLDPVIEPPVIEPPVTAPDDSGAAGRRRSSSRRR